MLMLSGFLALQLSPELPKPIDQFVEQTWWECYNRTTETQ